ncbi:MAG: methyltransferase family protein [Myxococcota bacterium]
MRFGIYALHTLFWLPYVVRFVLEPGPKGAAVHRRSAAGLWGHFVGGAVLYAGLALDTVGSDAHAPVRWAIAAALVLAGAALSVWTLRTFRSWRLKPELTAEHQLSTDGPFAYVRHPIYAAMDLLAVGSVVWSPHPVVVAGAVLLVLAGDWRARTEEGLLVEHFGDAYRDYMRRVKRLVPGVY